MRGVRILWTQIHLQQEAGEWEEDVAPVASRRVGCSGGGWESSGAQEMMAWGVACTCLDRPCGREADRGKRQGEKRRRLKPVLGRGTGGHNTRSRGSSWAQGCAAAVEGRGMGMGTVLAKWSGTQLESPRAGQMGRCAGVEEGAEEVHVEGCVGEKAERCVVGCVGVSGLGQEQRTWVGSGLDRQLVEMRQCKERLWGNPPHVPHSGELKVGSALALEHTTPRGVG